MIKNPSVPSQLLPRKRHSGLASAVCLPLYAMPSTTLVSHGHPGPISWLEMQLGTLRSHAKQTISPCSLQLVCTHCHNMTSGAL